MQQTEKYWNLMNRIIVVAFVLMAGVGAVLAFTPKVKELQSYQERVDYYQQRIDIAVAAERKTQDNIRRFKHDAEYVEKVAHEVGYAKANETIYHFPEEADKEQY